METDGRYMMENNYALLEGAARLVPGRGGAAHLRLVGRGLRRRRRSSARSADYETPLNVYGYSKFLFDQYVRGECCEARTAQVAGLRYFNVYGPNEAHKGRMASVAFHAYQPVPRRRPVKLFVGADGYERRRAARDFVHVDDVVSA